MSSPMCAAWTDGDGGNAACRRVDCGAGRRRELRLCSDSVSQPPPSVVVLLLRSLPFISFHRLLSWHCSHHRLRCQPPWLPAAMASVPTEAPPGGCAQCAPCPSARVLSSSVLRAFEFLGWPPLRVQELGSAARGARPAGADPAAGGWPRDPAGPRLSAACKTAKTAAPQGKAGFLVLKQCLSSPEHIAVDEDNWCCCTKETINPGSSTYRSSLWFSAQRCARSCGIVAGRRERGRLQHGGLCGGLCGGSE